jgi:hypothetical protein
LCVLRLFQSTADFGPGPCACDGGPSYPPPPLAPSLVKRKSPEKLPGFRVLAEAP